MAVRDVTEQRLRSRVASIAFLAFFVTRLAGADEGWTIRLDLLNLSVFGDDLRIAVLSEERTGDFGTVRDSRDLGLNLDSDQAFRVEVGRFGERWGWSLGAMWFDGPDGRLMLGPLTSDPATGTVTIFQAEALGRTVVAPDVGSGELYLHAQSHFYHGVLDATVSRELQEGEGSELLLLGGLKLAKYLDRVNQNLFVLGPEGWGLKQDGEAESDLMAGPMVGLRGRARVRRHSFVGSFSQGYLVGNVDFRSRVNETGPGGVEDRYLYTLRDNVAFPVSDLT